MITDGSASSLGSSLGASSGDSVAVPLEPQQPQIIGKTNHNLKAQAVVPAERADWTKSQTETKSQTDSQIQTPGSVRAEQNSNLSAILPTIVGRQDSQETEITQKSAQTCQTHQSQHTSHTHQSQQMLHKNTSNVTKSPSLQPAQMVNVSTLVLEFQ